MINHKKKAIFIHVQKTGGKSLRKGLGFKGGTQHEPATVLRERYGDHVWTRYIKIAFVRNPWDRLVSAFFYAKKGGNQSVYDLQRASYLPETFTDFIKNVNHYATLSNEHLFKPQSFWLLDEKGDVMVDILGRFETIDSDARKIAKSLNIRFFRLKKINVTQHDRYREYYSDETKEIVAEVFSSDISLFKYTF